MAENQIQSRGGFDKTSSEAANPNVTADEENKGLLEKDKSEDHDNTQKSKNKRADVLSRDNPNCEEVVEPDSCMSPGDSEGIQEVSPSSAGDKGANNEQGSQVTTGMIASKSSVATVAAVANQDNKSDCSKDYTSMKILSDIHGKSEDDSTEMNDGKQNTALLVSAMPTYTGTFGLAGSSDENREKLCETVDKEDATTSMSSNTTPVNLTATSADVEDMTSSMASNEAPQTLSETSINENNITPSMISPQTRTETPVDEEDTISGTKSPQKRTGTPVDEEDTISRTISPQKHTGTPVDENNTILSMAPPQKFTETSVDKENTTTSMASINGGNTSTSIASPLHVSDSLPRANDVPWKDPTSTQCDNGSMSENKEEEKKNSKEALVSAGKGTYANVLKVKTSKVPIKSSSPDSSEDQQSGEADKDTGLASGDNTIPPEHENDSVDVCKKTNVRVTDREPKKPPQEFMQSPTHAANDEPPSREEISKMNQKVINQDEPFPSEDGINIPEEDGVFAASNSLNNVNYNAAASLDNLMTEENYSELELEEKNTTANVYTSDPSNVAGTNSVDDINAGTKLRKRIVLNPAIPPVDTPPTPDKPQLDESHPDELDLDESRPDELYPDESPPDELHPDESPPDELHPDEPRPSDDESDSTGEEPTQYVIPMRQPTRCEQVIKLVMLFLAVAVLLFLGIAVLAIFLLNASDIDQSTTSEAVQDSTFIVNEEVIALHSSLWDGDGLNILVIGRLGTGKSTLIKGLFVKGGHIVPLSLERSHKKESFTHETHVINDVTISLTVWNHPKPEHVDAQKIEELQKFDLILYTIKMSETRFQPKDSNIMKTMLEILGMKFISKTVFILSHANQVGSLDSHNVHQKNKSILETKTREWRRMIISKLNAHSGEELQPEHFVHAAHPIEPDLYGVHWPSQVLAAMFGQLDESKRPALAKACEKYWVSALQGSYETGGCAS